MANKVERYIDVGTHAYRIGGDHPPGQYRRRRPRDEEYGAAAVAAGESAAFSQRRRHGAAAPHGPGAMVFGREHAGLSNEELDRCNYLLHIPTDATYSSLNLAAAVQVVAYELRMAQQHGPVMPPDTTPLASADQREGFYHHLEQVLTELQFLDPNNPKHLMRRLRRLFNRAALDQTEINILRGILTTVQRAVG